MRIAMFTDSYFPYISGVTRAVSTLRDSLQTLGHDVWVFCPTYPECQDEDGIYRFPSIKAPTNDTYYVAMQPFVGLRGQLLDLRPEVIHIHSPFNLCKAGWTVARRHGIPVVLTYHTMYSMYSHYVPLAGASVAEAVEKMALRMVNSVDAVITPSGIIADYLHSKGVNGGIHPIPNGIHVESFQGGDGVRIKNRFGIPQDLPLLITCGRLGAEKNLEVLLRAFALVASEIRCGLLLVGDGPQRQKLEDLAESLGVRERTYFAGTVPPEDMPHIYAAGELFLFSSLTDTQGLVLVEAKAAGLPAVAVGALGVKDMVADGEDGFLCENDPSDLASKALVLLSDKKVLGKMRQAAQVRAQAFSREASAARVLSCYETAMAGKSPPTYERRALKVFDL